MMPTLDSDAWNALSLGGTLAVRDAVVSRKLSPKKLAIVAASQYGYMKFVNDPASATLAKLTGESYYSSLLANVLGLSGILTALDSVGVTKSSEASLENSDLLPDVKVGSGMVQKALKNCGKSLEILIERQLLLAGLNMIPGANAMLPGALAMPSPNEPQPAKSC